MQPGSGIGDRGSAEPEPEPVPTPTVLEALPQPVPVDLEPGTSAPRPPASEPIPSASDPRPPASRPATVRFDSRPSGATIYLDEVRVGVTPMTVNNVTPGTHQVRMEMLGNETWRTSVTVEAGAQHFVGASLE